MDAILIYYFCRKSLLAHLIELFTLAVDHCHMLDRHVYDGPV